jgi:small-conductance mechanosensitive channel
MFQSIADWWRRSVDPLIDRIAPERELYGNDVERWLLALAALLGIWLVLRIVKAIVQGRAQTYADRGTSPWAKAVADMAQATRVWFLFVLSLHLSSLLLVLPERTLSVLHSVSAIVVILQAAIWGNVAIAYGIQHYVDKHRVSDAARVTTMSALAFLGKLILWTIALLLILDNLGVDVTALIAGLGVGGIAVALAAQNILSDLFASLSIVLDKPFVLGDFIVVGEFQGTVENIGLKTTRLRSLSGEQLVFPNSDLLTSRIRNTKRMQERRVAFSLGVTYQTPLAALREIPDLIKAAITSQEQTRFDRAHFQKFGDSALVFEAVYFVTIPDYARYMDIQQQINLRLLEEFAVRGIEFAYPTQTVHLGQPELVPSSNG